MVHASVCKGLFLWESSGKLAMAMQDFLTQKRFPSVCVYLIIMLHRRKREKKKKSKKKKRGSKLQV